MAIKLNKQTKKPFDKKLKAQDEVVQIKRSEWEAMQEAIAQVQTFMTDLVEGNLEIEILDDNEEPKDVEETDPEVEDIEVEGDPELEETDPDAEPEEDDVEGEDSTDEEKAEDEELTESLKDPEKRKAVLEFLKVSDAEKKDIEPATKKTGDKKPKRKMKRKTLQKAQDATIPDFTSRFRNDDFKKKALDADEVVVSEKSETEKFQSRFE